ncbi:MAG: hypothetical protein ACYSYL_00080 [Planctomycetota bacterium]
MPEVILVVPPEDETGIVITVRAGHLDAALARTVPDVAGLQIEAHARLSTGA